MSASIGERIILIREDIGVDAATFSQKIGMPEDVLLRVECGKLEPDTAFLTAIAKQWPQYAVYLLTDETFVNQRNPEVESLAQELKIPEKLAKRVNGSWFSKSKK